MEVALYDADAERLELFDSFARTAFTANANGHKVMSSLDAAEALDGAQKVVLQLDDNCARKEAKARSAEVHDTSSANIVQALGWLLDGLHNETQVVSLLFRDIHVPLDYYYRLDWPPEINAEQRRSIPHQVLRWIRGDEYLFELFKEFQRSPLKDWLEDRSTATVVSEA